MSTDSRSPKFSATWLEVIAAVDYLDATHRPGLTVWDAVEEAVRWWTATLLDSSTNCFLAAANHLPWKDPDQLRTSLERVLEAAAPIGVRDGHSLTDVFDGALRVWLSTMAQSFNDGYPFRGGFRLLHEKWDR